MKKADAVRLVKSAYPAEPSAEKREFLKRYRTRQLNCRELLLLQLRYMGLPLSALFGCALAGMLGAAAKLSADCAKIMAVVMPLTALISLTGLGRARRCGMEELELAARFSLRMLCTLRLVIIGIAGLLVTLSFSLILTLTMGLTLPVSFAAALVPYLLTASLCMVLIRRRHSSRSLYGCAVIAALVCAASLWGTELMHSLPAGAYNAALFTLLFLLLPLTGVEVKNYILESEEYQWNFC